MVKKVAVIGGGFTGLAAAVSLIDFGAKTVVFEAGTKVGGLAGSFRPRNRKWSLEKYYHHIFTNDDEMYKLADRVDWPVQVKSPLSTSFINEQEIQLDSPVSLLRFSQLNLFSRIWMGFGLLLLKIIPDGKFLEKWRVVDLLPKLIGFAGYDTIWKRLLSAKFGPYIGEVNMSWFWARIAKRTKNLGYFNGGFAKFAEKISKYIIRGGGDIRLNSPVNKILKTSNGLSINGELFDAVLVTVPAPVAKRLIKNIKTPDIKYLWGQTLILELSHKFIKGYWMNILEDNWPFLVTVEQTNMIDKKNYGNKVIVYLGNYLPDGHRQLSMNKEKIVDLYTPFLKKINKNFKKSWIGESYLFRDQYAQPVFPVNFSKKITKMKSGIKGVYLANMSMVYPYDRGTNFAVKMGRETAEQIIKDLS